MRGTGGAGARKRPLKDIKALMGMLTISIMAEPMSDRDFWRHVIQPRYGAPPGRPRRPHGRGPAPWPSICCTGRGSAECAEGLVHGRGSAGRVLVAGLHGRW